MEISASNGVAVPMREIHEIELSSVCNLACKYCPHPKLEREKAHMDFEVFKRTLMHLEYYIERGTQTEISLTGIGEAILHPFFIKALHLLRNVVGKLPIVMATNGVAVTDEIVECLRYLGVVTYVSTHRPEKAGVAVHKLRQAGVQTGTNTAFVDDSLNWAGQVKWHNSAVSRQCDYLGLGWAVVRQDGRVNACCMDAHSKYPLASVWDEPGSWMARPIGLCETCHLTVPDKFKAQAVAA